MAKKVQLSFKYFRQKSGPRVAKVCQSPEGCPPSGPWWKQLIGALRGFASAEGLTLRIKQNLQMIGYFLTCLQQCHFEQAKPLSTSVLV